ncbi:hypothetical protein [Loktanella sp. Alg231-35]|uniref:hypothetical protein n=1 Tax=Loktanella sp. Alg231-35 TaxID=1922220 RepID=UPI000D55CA47|nr:hypothetical protein [Loktanella sp. Alg231-35]
MHSAIHTLASYRADPDIFGERGIARGVTVKDPTFWDQYDNDTLIYDAIWCAERREITVLFPKLIGFEKAIRTATWMIDGNVVKPRRLRRFRVYDVLSLPCDVFKGTFTLTLGDHQIALPVSQADHNRFAGRRVIYTQVKDDSLDWVRDWAAAHQRNHGADAVLMSNNNSTEFSSEELRATLASVDGIVVADVLDVPLRYGPHQSTADSVGTTKFQQRTLLNLVKTRWFAKAYGVLMSDVDELVVSHGSESIFDATQRSWLKYIRFGGEWRYQMGDTETIRHAHHIFRRPKGNDCISKYCIVPDSVLGRRSWSVHAIESVNRRIFPASQKFHHFHCYGISTSWKKKRSGLVRENMIRDEKTAKFMEQTFAKQMNEPGKP